jgi:hypothetical protein
MHSIRSRYNFTHDRARARLRHTKFRAGVALIFTAKMEAAFEFTFTYFNAYAECSC